VSDSPYRRLVLLDGKKLDSVQGGDLRFLRLVCENPPDNELPLAADVAYHAESAVVRRVVEVDQVKANKFDDRTGVSHEEVIEKGGREFAKVEYDSLTDRVLPLVLLILFHLVLSRLSDPDSEASSQLVDLKATTATVYVEQRGGL
jgi:hypothetical protein